MLGGLGANHVLHSGLAKFLITGLGKLTHCKPASNPPTWQDPGLSVHTIALSFGITGFFGYSACVEQKKPKIDLAANPRCLFLRLVGSGRGRPDGVGIRRYILRIDPLTVVFRNGGCGSIRISKGLELMRVDLVTATSITRY